MRSIHFWSYSADIIEKPLMIFLQIIILSFIVGLLYDI